MLWPTTSGLSRRNVYLKVNVTEQPTKAFQSVATPRLLAMKEHYPPQKFIYYSNFKKTTINMQAHLREYLDKKELHADVLPLHGNLLKDQKLWHTNKFVQAVTPDYLDDKLTPNPVILDATSASANAGIDCCDIHGVIRDGFPPSVEDLIQEHGRAGRTGRTINGQSVEPSPTTDFYHLNVSLKSIGAVHTRIETDPDNSQQKQQNKTTTQTITETTPITKVMKQIRTTKLLFMMKYLQ